MILARLLLPCRSRHCDWRDCARSRPKRNHAAPVQQSAEPAGRQFPPSMSHRRPLRKIQTLSAFRVM